MSEFTEMSRSELKKRVRSADGRREIMEEARKNKTTMSTAYRQVARKKEKEYEDTDTANYLLAEDGLRIFSDADGNPPSPISAFEEDYQKDILMDKANEFYHETIERSTRPRSAQRNLISAYPEGSLMNPETTLEGSMFVLEPEIDLMALTTKIDYVDTTNVDLPDFKDDDNLDRAQMIDNPVGTQTEIVTLTIGEKKVSLDRQGIGVQWDGDFEASPLSTTALMRFAMEVGINHVDELVVRGIKLLSDSISADTDSVSSWSYVQTLEIENIYSNGKKLDAIIGKKTAVLLYEAEKATGYGEQLRPMPSGTLSNVRSRIEALNYTTAADADTGLVNSRFLLYNRMRTLGLALRSREIVVTDDYHAGTDMMRRYFRRRAGWYLQPEAPIARLTVPTS